MLICLPEGPYSALMYGLVSGQVTALSMAHAYLCYACHVCLCVQVLVPLIAYVGAPASGAHFNPIITFSFVITGIMVIAHCDIACASITNMPESLLNGARTEQPCRATQYGSYSAFTVGYSATLHHGLSTLIVMLARSCLHVEPFCQPPQVLTK